jgi:FkbM family methyltransferase
LHTEFQRMVPDKQVENGRAAGRPNRNYADQLIDSKRQLENAMCEQPDDLYVRGSYFECLLKIAASRFGLIFAHLPEIATPLMFRAATSDVWNLINIFSYAERPCDYDYGVYGIELPQPATVLDIGAYCGYSAVYFANRFPDAQIVCVEPPGRNFELLTANTAPYRNIRRVAAAVWAQSTVLQPAGHISGDWGNMFTPQPPCDAGQAGIPGYTIDQVIRAAGWTTADFIKCQAENAVIGVLCDGQRDWLTAVSCVCAIKPAGQWPTDDGDARLAATFPAEQFENSSYDSGLHVFIRRGAGRSEQHAEPRCKLLAGDFPQGCPIALHETSYSEAGFYKFGEGDLNLTPNPPGSPLASLEAYVTLDRHTRFRATIVAGPGEQGLIRFHLALVAERSGTTVASTSCELPPQSRLDWEVTFDPSSGPHRVSLTTERVGAAGGVWARFLHPQFC